MLVLPMPDYAHRYSLWRSLIVEAGGLILKWSDRFDLSSLTKVSDGYTGLVSTIEYRSESLTSVVYAQDNYIHPFQLATSSMLWNKH